MFESLSQQVFDRARQAAVEQVFSVCISVVDESGLLRGFLRMNNAVPGAIDVSLKKARMAALFCTDSIEIGEQARLGGEVYTLESTNSGLISFGGGATLQDLNGKVMGAVGVAGATVEADQIIALEAAGRP